MASKIPLSFPDITPLEINAATKALRSNQFALGPWTHLFEELVSKHTKNQFGVATNSGNSAMAITLESLGIGPGDEVITPAFAFPSTAAAIIKLGAKPRFADCDPRTLNLSIEDIKSKINSSTKGVIATYTFGNPAGIDQVAKLTQEFELILIEDARQAIGSKVNGEIACSFGRAAILAFHAASQVTCIEGGMIVTNDNKLEKECRLRRNHGYDHNPTITIPDLHNVRTDEHLTTIGSGSRLSEVHAAIGTVQMERLDEILEKRSLIARWYTSRLGGKPEIMCPTVEPSVVMSWDGYVIRLSDRFSRENRDEIIRGLHRHDIGATDFFQSIPTLPPFNEFQNDANRCPVASSVSERTIALPFYTSMAERDVDIVCQTLDLMFTRITFAN